MQNIKQDTLIIGYSGHAYVVLDILQSQDVPIIGYCDAVEKTFNPFNLNYLGKETDAYPFSILEKTGYFVCIGHNAIRAKVLNQLTTLLHKPAINVIHSQAVCSSLVQWHPEGGILVAANAVINAFAKIGKGVICNISCSIDHECVVGDYVHIAPSATLCGSVTVGDYSFIGANAVVKPNITIGKNVIVEAGAIVLQDIPDNTFYPTLSV